MQNLNRRLGQYSDSSSDEDDYGVESKYDNLESSQSRAKRHTVSHTGSQQMETLQSKTNRMTIANPQRTAHNVVEFALDDFDDDFEDDFENDFNMQSSKSMAESKYASSKPISFNNSNGKEISVEECSGIRKLLFGDRKPNSLNDAWTEQGFHFNQHSGLSYGLVQNNGGPCGIIAVVQAFILREILFSKHPVSNFKHINQPSQRNALIHALSYMVWNCKHPKAGHAIVTIPNNSINSSSKRTAKYKPDGITEKMMLHQAHCYEDVVDILTANINLLTAKFSHGVVVVLYSCILSHGIDEIASEMDSGLGQQATLIGSHNYASQELVNLLLVGYAHSNVFDDNKVLEEGTKNEMVLQGIKSRSVIGYLTLFEHYEYCVVGKNYKCAKLPIYVICSESHFSVLFSPEMIDESYDDQFDLYYYDELAAQDEEYRLTVNIDENNQVPKYSKSDLVSPIDHCIRTKYRNAIISWNGSEPLL